MNVGAKIMLTERDVPPSGSHLLCADAGRMVGKPYLNRVMSESPVHSGTIAEIDQSSPPLLLIVINYG
jgi:hypothetical protein